MKIRPLEIRYVGYLKKDIQLHCLDDGFTIGKIYSVERKDRYHKRYYFYDDNHRLRFRGFKSLAIEVLESREKTAKAEMYKFLYSK